VSILNFNREHCTPCKYGTWQYRSEEFSHLNSFFVYGVALDKLVAFDEQPTTAVVNE